MFSVPKSIQLPYQLGDGGINRGTSVSVAVRYKGFAHPFMAVLESEVVTWKLQGHWTPSCPEDSPDFRVSWRPRSFLCSHIISRGKSQKDSQHLWAARELLSSGGNKDSF